MEKLKEIHLGAMIGKGQAFGLLRNKCSAAEAECLKQIRDSKMYESLGLTWETFCRRHLRISRSYADKLIQRIERFGKNYFRLAGLMRMSPDIYRAVEPSLDGEHIRIDGELVPIAPENADQIRSAVQALRADLTRATQLRPTVTSIIDLQMRFDGCFALMRKLMYGNTAQGTKPALNSLVNYSIGHLTKIGEELRDRMHI